MANDDGSSAVAMSDRDLGKEEILSTEDREIVRMPVPEWGGFVYLRTISGEERDEFELTLLMEKLELDPTTGQPVTRKVDDYRNIRAKLLVRVLCDKDGNPIFTEQDIERLGKKSAAPLTRLYTKAQKLNAVSNADVDELAKNSASGAIVTG